MATKRWTSNPTKPKRHRPGKGEDAESEDEDYSEEDDQQKPAPPSRPTPSAKSFPKATVPAKQVAAVSLSDAPAINEDDFETESEGEAPAARTVASGAASEESDDESDSEADDDEESEEESSSEDEAPRKLIRPTFIRKDQRQAKLAGTAGAEQAVTTNFLSAQSKAEDPAEVARRKAAADALVQTQLEKQAEARAAGKKYWDDDEDNLSDDVDDTDDLDPEAELAAWKLRELKRVKRSRDAIEEAEREREEIERRRNLTAEERYKEDREHVEAQKAERDGKGQAGYMKKYFHKGAFYQDEEVAEELRKRDVMGAKFEDETNRELLPEYMQIRDMTKLGKKGRTRYKDLRSEDTGQWGRDLKSRPERWQGTDDRFAPDSDRAPGPQRSGANAAPVAERKPRRSPGPGNAGDRHEGSTRRNHITRSTSRSPRRCRSRSRDGLRRNHRDRSRTASSGRYSRSREREDSYLKRSHSPRSRDRYETKRRRVETD